MEKENRKINKVILNLIQDLQRLLGLFSNGVHGRCQIKLGMTSYVKGFTLIEILVVVVIIAVLATVAVSAYQRAVLKSRFSSLMPLAKTLAQGNEEYYLRNGQYTDDVDKLDIRAARNEKTQITLGNEDNHKYVLLTRDDINNNLRIYQQRSQNFPGETHCEALIDNAQANWLCRDALHGTFVGNKYGYAVYSLSSETVGTLARITYNYQGNKNFTDGDICLANSHGSYCMNPPSGSLLFDNGAKCVATYSPPQGAGTVYPCLRTNFSKGSMCIGNGVRACQGSQFDHSYCVANRERSCTGKFDNYSICYASAGTSCTGTYDPTSCCYGTACTQGKCEDNEYWKTRLDEIPPAPTYP